MKTVRARRIAHGGFTLTEVMIVVSILGVLMGLIVPMWCQARVASAKAACRSNLQRINSAKDLWALDYHKRAKDTPDEEDLFGFDCYIPTKLTCPAGGHYVLEAVKVAAYCTLPEHGSDYVASR